MGNNELAQLMKVIEKMQAKMEESDRKMVSLVVMFQKLKKEIQMDNNEQIPPP